MHYSSRRTTMTGTSADTDATDLTRRRVLQTAGGVAIATVGVASTSGTAAARPDAGDFRLGIVPFVEVKEEFPDAPTHDEMTVGACRYKAPGYVLDEATDRVLVTTGSLEPARTGGPVVAADGGLYDAGEEFPLTNSKHVVPVETDFPHLDSRYASVGTGHAYDTEGLAPGRRGRARAVGGAVRVDTGAGSARVAGDRAAAERQVAVKSRSGGTVTARQVLSVRNHGSVEVFGHEDYQLFPLNSPDPYTSRQVATLLSTAGDQVTELEDADLLAVPPDLDIDPDSNGGAPA